MSPSAPAPARKGMIIDRDGLQSLLDRLSARGFDVIGPTVRDGAIIYDRISSVDVMPEGWTDDQDAARYRLARRSDMALFGYAVGPHSWRRFLQPPEERLWQATRQQVGLTIHTTAVPSAPYAFIGVRACELRAISIQDRVFLEGPHPDRRYAERRRGAFIVAVNCTEAGGTCFCASMGSGPRAADGFDLALTELIDANGHRFLLEVGTDAGAASVEDLPSRDADAGALVAAEEATARAAAGMRRKMATAGLKELLQANPEHPHWSEVAERCLACANCTLVCPTCFCSTVADYTDLRGHEADRVRRWDSCFAADFSSIHGGPVRASRRARYRQWMSHKLAHWIDQFDISGCVGCGRCITWCPVGIDITVEAAAIRAAPPRPAAGEGDDDGNA